MSAGMGDGHVGTAQDEAVRIRRLENPGLLQFGSSSNSDEDRMERYKMAESKLSKMVEEKMKICDPATYTLIKSMEEYKAAINSNVRVVCHFYDDANLECEVMNFILSRLAEQHPEARFLKIHAGKNPGLVAELNISSIPTLALIKKAKVEALLVRTGKIKATEDFPMVDMPKIMAALCPRPDRENMISVLKAYLRAAVQAFPIERFLEESRAIGQ